MSANWKTVFDTNAPTIISVPQIPYKRLLKFHRCIPPLGVSLSDGPPTAKGAGGLERRWGSGLSPETEQHVIIVHN